MLPRLQLFPSFGKKGEEWRKLSQGWRGREVVAFLFPLSWHSSPLPPRWLWNIRVARDLLSGLATIPGFDLSIKTCNGTWVNKSEAFSSSPFSLLPWGLELDRPLIANTLSNDFSPLFILKVICEPITAPLPAVILRGWMSVTVVWEFGFGCVSDACSVVLVLVIDWPAEALHMGEGWIMSNLPPEASIQTRWISHTLWDSPGFEQIGQRSSCCWRRAKGMAVLGATADKRCFVNGNARKARLMFFKWKLKFQSQCKKKKELKIQ